MPTNDRRPRAKREQKATAPCRADAVAFILFRFGSRDRFKTQTKRLADFGDRVDGHIHASVFDAAKVTGIKTAAVGEVANRKPCGIASASDGRAYSLASDAPDGRCPSRVTGLPSIGFSLDDLAGGIGQRHRRAFALLDFGIGKGVSAEAAFITAIVVVPLLVRTEHELLRVDGE